jgi:hypothetical protein
MASSDFVWNLIHSYNIHKKQTKKTQWPVVRKRTIPTERPSLVGEVSSISIVTCMSDYRRGRDWLSGSTNNLQIVTTSNYNTPVNSRTRTLTTAHTKCFQFAFTSRFPATDPSTALFLRPYWLANVPQLTKLRVRVTLRLAVYRQSICLDDKTLDTHDQ